MRKYGKKYQAALKLIDTKKAYDIKDACELVKKTSVTKFESGVSVSLRLNIDTKQADQQIRGTVVLPHAPYVGTGLEHTIAHDCGLAVIAAADGVCTYMDSKQIRIKEKDGERTYVLTKFEGSNQETCINQTPIVHKGDKIKKGQIIADGPAMQNGDLALGQNITVAFMILLIHQRAKLLSLVIHLLKIKMLEQLLLLG